MYGLTIGRLEYLFEAVRLGGMRAAADFLDVAPSVVSRQIAALEKVARTPLLETNRRGAKPTEAGHLLIQYYRDHLAREEAVGSKLDALAGLTGGTVKIGAIHGFTDDLMFHVLHQFKAAYPDVAINLKLGGVNDVLGWLEEDEVHLGLIYGPGLDLHKARLKEVQSSQQPLCVVVPCDHPLAAASALTVETLFSYPFALASAGFGTRKIVEQIETLQQRRLNVALETDHLIGLTSFVRCGMGVTLLPAFAIHDDLTKGVLKAVPVEHELTKRVQAQLATRRGRELPLAAQRLQQDIINKMVAFKVANRQANRT
ncbi:DNA-binding transcriptional LysR family regulator [Paraburkholderia sp. BL18I3N2]|uniref:LysR family transcriptional regulator n=1 Tax=Paraburkholderia sp. BL18I3N2 TaxID=1938799 RepID=UPI000D056A03|nr:LysR family transcriptional regulator [Paraburkholderia sp. BL18I3N2]PRX21620.1 DNA-binding transcriptional LysR family regulator [Paraburkholderia sp. BL18I3N2]